MGAYGYGPGCCGSVVCGWQPCLTQAEVHQLSGSLELILAPCSGGFGFTTGPHYSTGVGVSVAEGDVGTKGIGNDLRLYGNLFPRPSACENTDGYTFDLGPITAEYVSTGTGAMCGYSAPAKTYDLQFVRFNNGCCEYSTTPGDTTIGDSNGASLWINRLSGRAVLCVNIPGGGLGGCHRSYRRCYIGQVSMSGGTLEITTPSTDPKQTCWANGLPEFRGSGVDESDTYPSTITIEARNPVASGKVWIGLRNSIGIAYEPSTRTWYAVELGADGNIASEIGSSQMTIPTIDPHGGFWWTDTGTASFAWFDDISGTGWSGSNGVPELKDFIEVDYAATQPLPSVRTGYVGASGQFVQWHNAIGCFNRTCAEGLEATPTWVRNPPVKFYLLTSYGIFPYQWPIYGGGSVNCFWENRVFRPYDIYARFDWGQTDPNKFTAKFRVSGDPQEAIYEKDLGGDFDVWRPFTLPMVQDTSSNPPQFPPSIELHPSWT